MLNKIKSLFSKKEKDMIPERHEKVTSESIQLLNKLLEEDEVLIKKYNM